MVNSQSHRENREVQCNCQPQDGEQSVTERTERFSAIASHRMVKSVTERTERFSAVASQRMVNSQSLREQRGSVQLPATGW